MKTEIRFGKPSSYDYETIIDQFSGTKINSIRTSSIPLVQFWKNTDIRLNELLKETKIDSENIILCFEYPTPSKGRGKSSMTDLMILCRDTKIAIEAKFTEYLEKNIKNEYEPISKWQSEKNIDNRKTVLNHWTQLIKPFSNGFDNSSIQEMDYQFYHRTASACLDTKRAVIVYQIFYENGTELDLQRYIDNLKSYVERLNPNDNLSFYIWEIETILKIKPDDIKDPFIEMKSRNVYEFGINRIRKM